MGLGAESLAIFVDRVWRGAGEGVPGEYWDWQTLVEEIKDASGLGV